MSPSMPYRRVVHRLRKYLKQAKLTALAEGQRNG